MLVAPCAADKAAAASAADDVTLLRHWLEERWDAERDRARIEALDERNKAMEQTAFQGTQTQVSVE